MRGGGRERGGSDGERQDRGRKGKEEIEGKKGGRRDEEGFKFCCQKVEVLNTVLVS